MGEMRLLIYYGGMLSDDNYEGGNKDIVFVPCDLTYNDLKERINNRTVNVDSSKFSIELRAVLISTGGKRVIARIENDKDVKFFMREDKLIPEIYVITVEMKDDGIAAQNDEGQELQDVIVSNPNDQDVEEETRKRQLEEEERRKRKRQLKLYQAAVNGNWGEAEGILKKHPDDITSKISKVGGTVLHIATAASHTLFVEQLMEKYVLLKQTSIAFCLAETNKQGYTAFCLAAANGNMDLIKLMMKEENKIAEIRAKNRLPVQMAALYGQEDIAIHLYKATDYMLTDKERIELLVTLIDTSLYGAALQLLDEHKDLATLRAENGETALHALARKPLMSDLHNPNQQGILNFFNLFSGINMVHMKKMDPKALELVQILWGRIILLDAKTISSLIKKPSRLIFDAAVQGNDELLSELISAYPELIFKRNDEGYTIFHVAVLYRHENVFDLIYQMGSIKDFLFASNDNTDNILHLAAKLPPPNRLNIVSGAALQLQRELLWFKELSEVVPPYIEAKNSNGETPKALFTRQHNYLLKEGEEWMKKTAESCMIVATLIATVVFAAAFTVPGGIKEDTGSPNLLKKVSFIIFSIFDPISLVFSTCSIITFLSILTARFTLEDFHKQLPTKLFLGISTLFISIATMMVVFCATFFILFNEGIRELALVATVLASIPVLLFLWQQHRLLWDVFRSTYISGSLFHHGKQKLISTKEK